MAGGDDELDVSPQRSSVETNWGMVLMVILMAVLGCAIFWDYGAVPQPEKAGVQATTPE